ncbi:hypothetical protein Hdeb2414_s0002g00078151 [Helianthus debilis subsp. tardiflorus]
MDGVNELDENSKISNPLDPDAERQTFKRKSQNWPNLKDENCILLYLKRYEGSDHTSGLSCRKGSWNVEDHTF